MSEINRELQLTLQAAAREAIRRQHAYLTLEHMLYALLHDERGEEVLRGSGVRVRRLKGELEKFLDEEVEKLPEGGNRQLQQTLAFHRVIEAAVHQATSSEKDEVEAGDLIAALFQEPDSHAVALLRAHGVTRLDVLKFVSHGIAKDGAPRRDDGTAPAHEMPLEGGEDDLPEDPIEAFASDLTARAREGGLDPLVGRETELERTVHILARRRKNNPIFVGETGVGKTAVAEGLAQRIVSGDVPDDLRDAEIFALDIGALLEVAAVARAGEERFKALIAAPAPRIVWISSMKRMGFGCSRTAAISALKRSSKSPR